MLTGSGQPTSGSSLVAYFTRITAAVRIAAGAPWFPLVTLIALRARRIWGAWEFRDLTSGDTSSYAAWAVQWATHARVNMLYSPLYTAFYGTVYALVPDRYWANLIHWLLIVVLLDVLILAIMLRLLPLPLSWLAAAWWVVMPINFNTLYEVHLFALILPLLALVLVLYRPGSASRGAALGILVVDGVLVRNEVLVAAALWFCICLLWELRQVRRPHGAARSRPFIAYGLPLVVAAAVIVFFDSRALLEPTAQALETKEAISLCQAYSYSYEQRNEDWSGDPWRQCGELMERIFKQAMPTAQEALRANPRAMAAHVLWNLRLLPAGIQVGLFGSTSAGVNPDYAPIQVGNPLVLLPSLLVLGLLSYGIVQIILSWEYWYSTWLGPRLWGWILFICLPAVMPVVLLLQRPRSAYMFLFTLLLMGITAMAAFVLLRNLRLERFAARVFSLIVLLIIVVTPAYFRNPSRPLLTVYERLEPSREFLEAPGAALATHLGFAQPLCSYFTKNPVGGCVGYGLEMMDALEPGVSLGELFASQPVPVTTFYADEGFMANYGDLPAVQEFLTDPGAQGWKMVAMQDGPSAKWQLYVNSGLAGAVPP